MDSENAYSPDCAEVSWNVFGKQVVNGKLSVLSVNVRSIKGKFNEILSCLSSLKGKITFIIITETWLNEDCDSLFEIDGYKSCSIYRNGCQGGGIKLFYLEHINIQIVDEFTSISGPCESLFVTATVPGYGRLGILGIYRPPNRPIRDFLSYMETFLSNYGRSSCILIGDFNLNIDKQQGYVLEYINLLISFGFYNEIDKYTYVSPITNVEKTCLDHVWHNCTNTKRLSYVIQPCFADHNAISVIFDANIGQKPLEIKFRDFFERNIEAYLRNIYEIFIGIRVHNGDIS